MTQQDLDILARISALEAIVSAVAYVAFGATGYRQDILDAMKDGFVVKVECSAPLIPEEMQSLVSTSIRNLAVMVERYGSAS